MDRDAIPAELKRRVLVEAGHRCAIPTCRQIPIEIAHIVPWSEVRQHEFPNLIALCPTCHTRYDRGDVDRKSMLIYKTNLGLLNSRYCDVERRILEHFALNQEEESICLPGMLDIMVMYLVRDGILAYTGRGGGVKVRGIPSHKFYVITETGRAFVANWREAQALE